MLGGLGGVLCGRKKAEAYIHTDRGPTSANRARKYILASASISAVLRRVGRLVFAQELAARKQKLKAHKQKLKTGRQQLQEPESPLVKER